MYHIKHLNCFNYNKLILKLYIIIQREFLEKLKTNCKSVILQKNTLAYNKFILIYTRNAVRKTIFYQTGLIYSHIKLNN